MRTLRHCNLSSPPPAHKLGLTPGTAQGKGRCLSGPVKGKAAETPGFTSRSSCWAGGSSGPGGTSRGPDTQGSTTWASPGKMLLPAWWVLPALGARSPGGASELGM